MNEDIEKINEWQCIAGIEKDVEFSSLRQSGLLTWFPMVGKYYFQQPPDKRILIVGESVYGDWKYQWSEAKETPETLAKNPDHVRFNVYNSLDDSGFHRNIVRTIAGMCPAGKLRRQFWEKVSFLDLIQTAMKDALQRPTSEQGKAGWEAFWPCFDILRPKATIIFGIGTDFKSIDSFVSIAKKRFKFTENAELNLHNVKCNRTYAKRMNWIMDGEERNFFFVKHPSRCYSAQDWRNFLACHIPEIIEYYSANAFKN